jgi:hypothetical protein
MVALIMSSRYKEHYMALEHHVVIEEQAPRQWHEKSSSALKQLGFISCAVDGAVARVDLCGEQKHGHWINVNDVLRIYIDFDQSMSTICNPP